MKRILISLLIVGSLLGGTGCAFQRDSTGALNIERGIYISFTDTWNVALTAYDGYSERVIQGGVSKKDEEEIDKVWNDFRTAFTVAFSAASQDWSGWTPENVRKLSEELRSLINLL